MKTDETHTKDGKEHPEISDSSDEGNEDIKDLVELYLKEIGQIPLLTPEEEFNLAYLADKGDKEARQRLIEANQRLVVRIAGRVSRLYRGGNPKHSLNFGLHFSDLIQAGNLGLTRAVEKFDWRKGYKFSTYAWLWILGAIWQELRSKSKFAFSIDSDEGENDEGEETNLHEKTRDPHAVNPYKIIGEEIVLAPPLMEPLQEALKALSAEERQILELHFGLGDGPTKTPAQISRILGIPTKRVKEIEAEGLRKLSTDPRLADFQKRTP